MRTIACEGYCPFLLLAFSCFCRQQNVYLPYPFGWDNKYFIFKKFTTSIYCYLIINLMKKMPLIRLEPSKKMVNCGFVPLMLQEY